MGRKRIAKFSTRELHAAKQLLIGKGQTHAEFGAQFGVSASTVKQLLSGRLAARHGASHRMAVALGLKKEINSVTDFGESQNLSRLGGDMSELAKLLGPEPTEYDQQKIDLLNRYPGAQVANEPSVLPPGFEFAKFARRHGWKASTVRQVCRRYAGNVKKPAHHTVAWQVCAALSLELGGEICMGMANKIAELRERWAGHLAKPARNNGRKVA